MSQFSIEETGVKGMYDWSNGSSHGWLTEYDKGGYESIRVIVSGVNRAWREVEVFGTKSIKRALSLAEPHFLPAPQPQREGLQEVFGSFVRIG